MFDVQVEQSQDLNDSKAVKRANSLANLRPAQKGEVRNPRGRSKKDYDVAAMAQKHALKAIETLAEVMTNIGATPAARVSAASELLDRGFGRSPQSLDVTHQIGFSEQFEDYMRGLMGKNARVIDAQAVDAAE